MSNSQLKNLSQPLTPTKTKQETKVSMKLWQKPSNPRSQGDKSFNSVLSKVKVYFILFL